MAYPYIVQGSNVTVVIGNKPHAFSKTHLFYNRIIDAIKASDWAAIDELIDPKATVINYGAGNVTIQGDTLFWKGDKLHNSLAAKIINMYQEGFSIEPMVLFMENLMQNPSKRAVNELYGFLEKGELPITPDGCFLSYKKVRQNYKDVHSGEVLNKPAYLLTADEAAAMPMKAGKVTVTVENGATVVSMERNDVDDDKDRTCSSGLHFCSKHYLGHFGGDRIMILKINPRDVVSIPSDYNDSKGRACRYEVVGELGVDQNLEGTVNEDFVAVDNEQDDYVITDAGRVVQEYDSKGRALSMTRDAIRKRLARREGRY